MRSTDDRHCWQGHRTKTHCSPLGKDEDDASNVEGRRDSELFLRPTTKPEGTNPSKGTSYYVAKLAKPDIARGRSSVAPCDIYVAKLAKPDIARGRSSVA
ncbi:MAG TPA: hypothetical protein PKB15_02825, partial [Acidimicrobiia bacterium]|nr:hypothetical protein [Acidimicrobiia bacterium]